MPGGGQPEPERLVLVGDQRRVLVEPAELGEDLGAHEHRREEVRAAGEPFGLGGQRVPQLARVGVEHHPVGDGHAGVAVERRAQPAERPREQLLTGLDDQHGGRDDVGQQAVAHPAMGHAEPVAADARLPHEDPRRHLLSGEAAERAHEPRVVPAARDDRVDRRGLGVRRGAVRDLDLAGHERTGVRASELRAHRGRHARDPRDVLGETRARGRRLRHDRGRLRRRSPRRRERRRRRSVAEQGFGELDEPHRRRGHGELGRAAVVRAHLHLAQPLRCPQERRGHGDDRGRARERQVHARDQRIEVGALLGDDDAAVAHGLEDPHPLERGRRTPVQVEEDLARRQVLVLDDPHEEVRPGVGHLLVRRDQQLGAELAQRPRLAAEEEVAAYVGGAQVRDVVGARAPRVAVPAVPPTRVAQAEPHGGDPATGELLSAVTVDVDGAAELRRPPR